MSDAGCVIADAIRVIRYDEGGRNEVGLGVIFRILPTLSSFGQRGESVSREGEREGQWFQD